MRALLSAIASTSGSIAFEMSVDAGYIRHFEWAIPWFWGLSAALWVIWVVSHDRVTKGRLKEWHLKIGWKVYLIRIGVFIAALLVVALPISWLTHGRSVAADQKAAPAPPTEPPVQQTSKGNNSPNVYIRGNKGQVITGNYNTVNNSDPYVRRRLDEIKRLIQEQQGAKATPDALLKKYPLGYVIFDIDKSERVFPYATESLFQAWHFDWNAMRAEETKHNGKDAVLVYVPMTDPNGNSFMLSVGGEKKVGFFANVTSTPEFVEKLEILAIGQKGIVFLVGFDHPRH